MKLYMAVLALVAFASAKQFYDAKFDKIDVSEIIDNPKLIKNYANCFLEKEPCTDLIRELGELIQDAIRTACNSCSPKQIELIRTLAGTLQIEEPALFAQVVDMFDPNRNLRHSFRVLLGL